MLERMRAHAQSWIAKALLGGIILSFALWGVADYFLSPKLEPVAEVDGKPIPPREFAMAYEREIAAMQARLGNRFTRADAARIGLPRATLEALIDERLMRAEAKKLGLVVPDAILAATVQSTPGFQTNGHFDPARYAMVVRALGFARPRDYEQEVRTQILAAHLRAALSRSAIVSEREALARFMQEHEQRSFLVVRLNPKELAVPEPDEQQLREWFEAHRDRYRTPTRIALAYVLLSPDAMAGDIEVSSEEIRKAYEAHKARYTTPEARRLWHWWMPTDTEAQRKQALAVAKKIAERVRKGTPLAKAVKEVSDRKAEDLGWMKRGELADRLEKVAFALKKGEVSAPVVTDKGVHLFWLADVRPARVRPLEEVRNEIAHELALAHAREEVDARADELDDALGRTDSLEEAARELGIALHTKTATLADLARDADLGAPEVIKALRELAPGDPPPLLELEDGRVIALEVRRRIPAQPMPFADARPLVRRDWMEAKRHELARSRAQAWLKRLAEGASANALASEGASLVTIPPVTRAEAEQAGLPHAAVAKAYEARPGDWLDEIFADGSAVVLVQVRSVKSPDRKAWEKLRDRVLTSLRQEMGQVRVARWMASLRKRHEVAIHEEALRRALR